VFLISMFLGIPDPLVRGMDLDLLRSFHHQSKIVRKTYISIVLRLLSDFVCLKNDVNISLKSTVICKKKLKKYIIFCCCLEEEQDPDSDQNVTDPERR
jgi:hypothetical protein